MRTSPGALPNPRIGTVDEYGVKHLRRGAVGGCAGLPVSHGGIPLGVACSAMGMSGDGHVRRKADMPREEEHVRLPPDMPPNATMFGMHPSSQALEFGVTRMGLWEWITDRLSKDQSQTAHSPGGGKESSPGWGDTEAAVATAEATKELGAKRPDEHEDAWWAPEGGGLVDVPRTERPGLTPEGLALENVLVSHFDGHDLKMPSLLHVAERVLAQLRRRDCDLSAVAREIAQDQVVTAAVLRMANSPLYRGLHKITGLQPALARLGTKAIRTLMLHESIREAMFHGKGELRHFAEILWARSLASAHLMRGLSTFTGLDEEDASLIGLLHDIGGVIVLRIVQTHLVAVQDLIDEATFEYLCAECHQEFGELVADAWKLPASLTKLISDHHSYPAANDPLRMARLQLVLNDMILACLGYMPHVPYALLDSRVVQDLGLADRRGFVAFLAELPGQLEETIEAL